MAIWWLLSMAHSSTSLVSLSVGVLIVGFSVCGLWTKDLSAHT